VHQLPSENRIDAGCLKGQKLSAAPTLIAGRRFSGSAFAFSPAPRPYGTTRTTPFAALAVSAIVTLRSRGAGGFQALSPLASIAARRTAITAMAEEDAEIRFKANTTVLAQNGVVAKLFVISFAKKFH
jgi:hypothetical protein